MNVLIVEDELIAQNILRQSLERLFDDLVIVGVTETVKDTLEWLRNEDNKADIIFMDVELRDGNCFEIFRQENIVAKVVLTTAYDKYAVKAFEVGSVDYLLKPYDDEAVKRAVTRCHVSGGEDLSVEKILSALSSINSQRLVRSRYKRRIIVRLGQKIIPVDVSDVAYLLVEGKSKYVVTREGVKYYIDTQIDDLLEELDPAMFFRISRNSVISSSAIKSIDRIYGGRLKIVVDARVDEEMIVSRARVNDFLAWLA